MALMLFLLVLAEALPSSTPPRTRRLIRNRPPLIDSTLLRFLTAHEDSKRSKSDDNLPVDGMSSLTRKMARPADSKYDRESFVTDEVAWISQYERSNVAALLHSAGIDAALSAGMIVENMAVERAAQKRMRCFLKERDRELGLMGNDAIVRSDSSDPGDCLLDVCNFSRTDNMEQVIELLHQYGLSSKDVCEILIHSPGIAFMQPRREEGSLGNGGESLQCTLDRVFSRLLMGQSQPYELKLRKYDSRKVVRNTPGLLTVRGSHSATKMVQMLISLGVSSNSISRDKNALPVLLSREPAAVFRLVAFLSSDAVRMPVDKIGPLLRRTECQDLLNAIAPVPRLEQQRVHPSVMSARRSNPAASAVVAAQVRQAIINSVYRGMSETVQTLRHEIGTHDLGKVIAAFPSVLLLDATRQILPTAHYLMNELGICKDDLPSVLQLYPALLRLDVEQMRNVVSYLVSLEVSEENLGSIFRSFPVLLTLDIEHDMEPVVAFLRSMGISNVGRFISRLPPVLCYSVERELRPKYEFLTTVCTDARFEVSKFPAFFSYPLERVIKTRYEYLRDVKRIPTPLLSLDHVLSSGDKDFAVRVARDPDGSSYARFVDERRKMLAISAGTKQTSGTPSFAEAHAPAKSSPKNETTVADSSHIQFPPSIAVIPT
jgi:mTERF